MSAIPRHGVGARLSEAKAGGNGSAARFQPFPTLSRGVFPSSRSVIPGNVSAGPSALTFDLTHMQ